MKKLACWLISIFMLLGLLAGTIGCSQGTTEDETPSSPEQEFPLHDPLVRFKIATTTSLYDTGLWYYLEPIFEEKANVEMDIIYAGTGIALEHGRNGDVDAIIVHDRAREDQFIADGYGINRRNFGYNFFLIAGPSSDPAGINGSTATEAFIKMRDAGIKDPDAVKFVSRGDESGTHAKEKLIWKEAGCNYEDIQKSGQWYVEAGRGMGPTLLMANEMQAYVLADISTFLAYNLKSGLSIEPIVDEDPIFLNVYAAIAINPEMHSKAKIDIANEFINWLIGPEVQDIMGTYGKAEYGRSLFFPIASCDMEGCPPVEDYAVPVPEYAK